jgi:hypothetical protein
MQHPQWFSGSNRIAAEEKVVRVDLPALRPKGGDWRTMKAEMPSPRVFLPGSFTTVPSPDLPVGRP